MTFKEFRIQLALGTLSFNMKMDIAENPDTSVEVLTKLATDKTWIIRHRTASNLNTPIEVLVKLSKDKAQSVRWEVAENPNTPKETLTKLSGEFF